MSLSHPQQPPKPAKLRAAYEIAGDVMRIEHIRRHWGAGLFLVLWLTGWTVGCVALAVAVVVKRQWFILLFGLPFWASWIFVAALVASMFFLREILEVDSDGIRYRCRVLIPVKHRAIPLDEVRGFSVGHKSDLRQEGRGQPSLEIRTIGKPLELFSGMPEAELRWLVAQLRALVPASDEVETPEDPQPEEEEPPFERTIKQVTGKPLQGKPLKPPSDSDWLLVDEADGLEFISRGRLQWGAAFSLLFINCFWNGIVSVFLVALFGGVQGNGPQGWERVGLAVFLIPFEVIGLIMLVGLLFTLLEPVRRLTWTLREREIECRLRWLGIGPRWRYEVPRLDRIDVKEIPPNSTRNPIGKIRLWKKSDNDGTTSLVTYGLVLVDTENREVCTIGELTQGEARWFADRIRRARPRWFR